MRRILIIAGIAVGFLGALASPALAKGAGLVSITGPGLSKPITFGGTETKQGPGAFWEFMSQTGVLEGGNAVAPIEALGPRYRLTIYLSPFERPGARLDLSKADRFTVSMYPYAVDGPWFHVPEGATTKNFDLSAGWTTGSSEALNILVRHGLPRTSPVAFSTRTPKPAASASPLVPASTADAAPAEAAPVLHRAKSSAGVRTGIAVGAILALLVAVVAVAGRPRRTRS
jgi:hypothetical protein